MKTTLCQHYMYLTDLNTSLFCFQDKYYKNVVVSILFCFVALRQNKNTSRFFDLTYFHGGHLYSKGQNTGGSFMPCSSPPSNTAPHCRLPLKFCFIKVPACMAAQSGPPQKQGDYGAPGLVFENNQSGLWRGSLVIFPTRTAISVASPCSCME